MEYSHLLRQLGFYARQLGKSRFSDRLRPTVYRFALRTDSMASQERLGTYGDNQEDEDEAAAKLTAARKRKLLAFIDQFDASPRQDHIQRNIEYLRQDFCLSDDAAAVVGLLVDYQTNYHLEELADKLSEVLQSPEAVIGALLGFDVQRAEAVLSHDGELGSRDIIALTREADNFSSQQFTHGVLVLAPVILAALQKEHRNREAWTNSLLGKATSSPLTLADFSYLGPQLDLVVRALKGWAQAPEPGLNIMLVGPVGTGKTELASVLAQAAGFETNMVGETGTKNAEPTRQERLSHLSIASALLGRMQGSPRVLLLDEAEDVLESVRAFSKGQTTSSKLYLNNLVGRCKAPVIWTTNATDRMEASVIRRMTLVIRVGLPDTRALGRIWTGLLSESGVSDSSSVANDIAQRWASIPPGIAASATKAAKLAGGGSDDIELALTGISRAMGGAYRSKRRNRDFDTNLVNSSEPLGPLLAGLRQDPCFSILAYGPPGGGKSEFGRWVARELGFEVMHKRASSVVSPFVGQTEISIAAMFEEARDTKAMLIIDEIDTFLAPRSGAHRSWEVSQVNEMLTWLEEHEYPIIGTSNALDRIDDAAKRRFDYKLHFDYLRPEQMADTFRAFFGMELDRRLPRSLTAGNFAAVARQVSRQSSTSVADIVRRLEREADTLSERKAVGF